MLQLVRVCLVGLIAAFLAGCAGEAPVGSVVGGECRLVSTPQYAVKGKTNYDQRWVNVTTESLVRGCGQARPAARPASFDQPVTAATEALPPPRTARSTVKRKPVARSASPMVITPKPKPTVKPSTKKRWWWRKTHDGHPQIAA